VRVCVCVCVCVCACDSVRVCASAIKKMKAAEAAKQCRSLCRAFAIICVGLFCEKSPTYSVEKDEGGCSG